MTCMGEIYETGTPVDLKRAFSWYEKGAACGDGRSMLKVAQMLQDGSAGKTDKVKAYAYYLLASRKVDVAKAGAASLRGELNKKEEQNGERKAREMVQRDCILDLKD